MAQGMQSSLLPPGQWEMAFCDEFDGAEADTDRVWEFQNGPSGHILCSRWRENARVRDGVLSLIARQESRGGQNWTAASLWTRRTFQYGYFESRYSYAPATGTNNSFWIMTRGVIGARERGEDVAAAGRGPFEIDINEGHYPDVMNMNVHDADGNTSAMTHRVPGSELARVPHVYGLDWNERELVWYLDGREIRRERNVVCHSPAPVWLSLAVIDWAGPVTDAIDGASMDVDYVRVFRRL